MQTELLKVTGMTCGGCSSKVTKALTAVPGVNKVDVSLAAGEATIQYDERLTSQAALQSAVKGAGFGLGTTGTEAPSRTKGCC